MSRKLASWYCLETQHRGERLARQELERKGFKAYVPEFQVPQPKGPSVVKPFFPGYLFVTWCRKQSWHPILSTIGVKGFLNFGNDNRNPTPMPLGEVERLAEQLDPNKQIAQGAQVQVIGENSILRGQVGICKLSDKERITLLFKMFNSEITYTFDRKDVRLAG